MIYSGNKCKGKNARSRRYSAVFIVAFFSAFLTCGLIFSTYSHADKTKLHLELIGDKNHILSVNEMYEDEGVKLTINNKEVDIKDVSYTVDNKVTSDILGEYTVDYHVTYEDKTYNISRKVTVVDDVKPELVVLTREVTRSSCGNNLRYYAFDNYDGVITDKVVVSEEDSQYKLVVTDSSGNESVAYVPFANEGTDIVLELKGTLIEYVVKGEAYVDKGIKVSNICGRELNINYSVESTVDTNVPGTYRVRYKMSDSPVEQERIVVVYDKVTSNNIHESGEKVVYLTFDDGPGAYTEELLDILAKYDVKATFFVTAQFKKYLPLLKREHDDGHVVALHTKTHDWNIYRSFENYYKDFLEMNSIIEEYTGAKTKIFRFPGGGSNTISRGKSLGVMKYNVSQMNKLGYTYFDWNVDSGDAAGAQEDKIFQNVINGISSRNYSVVLMHDIKRPTINTIEKIIQYGLDNGYTFATLTADASTVHHHVNN